MEEGWSIHQGTATEMELMLDCWRQEAENVAVKAGIYCEYPPGLTA